MVEGRIEKTLRRIRKYLPSPVLEDNTDILVLAGRQLDEYFAGIRKEFDLPLLPLGTDFQLQVWDALMAVSYAQTASYKTIAEAVCRSSSVRAVANAIGANPLSILIPCHRIIGTDGTLTGYAGGLEAKRYLLELENKYGSR